MPQSLLEKKKKHIFIFLSTVDECESVQFLVLAILPP
jgi:hypothetical protein